VPANVKGELTAALEFKAEPFPLTLKKTTFTVK